MFLGGQEKGEPDGDMGAVRIGERHVVIEQRGHFVKIYAHSAFSLDNSGPLLIAPPYFPRIRVADEVLGIPAVEDVHAVGVIREDDGMHLALVGGSQVRGHPGFGRMQEVFARSIPVDGNCAGRRYHQ